MLKQLQDWKRRFHKYFKAVTENHSSRCKRASVGRPQQGTARQAFLKTTEYNEENYDKQKTISDMTRKMKEYSGDESIGCGYTLMKNELKHLGDQIVITET